MAVESVDSHLGEATVLAVVLHPHTWLEAQAVGKRAGVDQAEHAVVDNAHQHGAVAALEFAFAAGDHYLVEHEGVGFDFEVDFQSVPCRQGHIPGLGNESYRRCLHGVFAGAKVAECVVSAGIGYGECARALEHDVVVREVLAGGGVNRMAYDIGITGVVGQADSPQQRRQHQRCQRGIKTDHKGKC